MMTSPEEVKRNFVDVDAVDVNSASSDGGHAEEREKKTRLPTSGSTDHAHFLSWR